MWTFFIDSTCHPVRKRRIAFWGSAANHKGTVESLLLSCPALSATRADLMQHCWSFLDRFPQMSTLATTYMAMDPVQFLLDCSTMGPVITAVQRGGEGVLNPLFKVTRNYCHVLHNARVLKTDYLVLLIFSFMTRTSPK